MSKNYLWAIVCSSIFDAKYTFPFSEGFNGENVCSTAEITDIYRKGVF